METFASLDLHSNILKGLAACSYQSPTKIQAKAIPLILDGQDVIAATETGSGKTAAFVLPALHLLAETKKQHLPRILILTPTRELASQITNAIRTYSQFLKIKVANIIGGVSYVEQRKMLSQPCDILVATPGRLIDYLKNKRIDLSAIEMFVLDEADRMLDMGFIDDVNWIAKFLTKKQQTLLFTATLDKKLIKLISHLLTDPVTIDLSRSEIVPQQIKQQLFIASNREQKITFLDNILDEKAIFKGIIFSSTKIGADKIASYLKDRGHQAVALHGDLKQHVRQRSVEKFRSGKVQFIVATDVASRGIHIEDVSHVINFDLPRCSNDYVHRVGRTGRAGKEGTAISLATKDERSYISNIEHKIGKELQIIDINQNPLSRQILEKTKKAKPKKRSRPKKNWSKKARRQSS